MLNADKKDSSELYEDRETQALLSKFLSGDIKTLEPIYDPKTGYHYPAAQAIVGDANKVQSIIDKLTEEKILEKKLRQSHLLPAMRLRRHKLPLLVPILQVF